MAHYVGETAAALAPRPLAETLFLPHQLGGRQMFDAEFVSPVAFVAGLIQATRCLESMWRPGPPTHPPLPLFLGRESGRPGVGEWAGDADARDGLCSGVARCRRERARECAAGRCEKCCVLSCDESGTSTNPGAHRGGETRDRAGGALRDAAKGHLLTTAGWWLAGRWRCLRGCDARGAATSCWRWSAARSRPMQSSWWHRCLRSRWATSSSRT